MMNCTEFDLARSLPRLRQRALAASQGISMTEAREEMRDFLYLESLRAELSMPS